MNTYRSFTGRIIAGCILLATASSCNLADDLKAAQAAGEPLHASGVSVRDGVSSGSGHIVHLSFGGIPEEENTRVHASIAAAIFFASLKKTTSFDSIEVTLKKTLSEEDKGIYSTTTSTSNSYMFAGGDVKKVCALYETLVKPFNREIHNLQQLRALCDPAYLPDSALGTFQQLFTTIESEQGKIATTRFGGFARGTDSSGKPAFIIKCNNFNAKGDPIMFCKFVFFQNTDKVAGVSVQDIVRSTPNSAPHQTQ